MEISVYIVCALIALLLILFVSHRVRNGNAIPGPKGLPIFGCLFEITVKTMHTKFSEYAEKHGDIVRINILGKNIVTLNTVELVQKAFTDDRYKTHLNDRPTTFFGKYVAYDHNGILLTTDGHGHVHSELRKLFTKGFRVYGDGIKVFEEKVLQEIVLMKSRIKEIGDAEFDIVSFLRRSLSNLLSVLLSGEPINDLDDVNIFWEFNDASLFMLTPKPNIVCTVAPFMRFVPGAYRHEFQKIMTAREKIFEKYLYRIKETRERGEIRGIVDFLLEEQEIQRKKNAGNDVILTDETIKTMEQEFVGAGIMTTLST